MYSIVVALQLSLSDYYTTVAPWHVVQLSTIENGGRTWDCRTVSDCSRGCMFTVLLSAIVSLITFSNSAKFLVFVIISGRYTVAPVRCSICKEFATLTNSLQISQSNS